MNIVKTYHHNLLKYKDKHKGETCYIFGSGPTINNFKIQEPGIFIGCNHIIKHNYIKKNLKYYFFGHGYPDYNKNNTVYNNHREEVDNLGNHIEKFAMVSRDNDISVHNFTKEMIESLHKINAIPCDITIPCINKNIHEESLTNCSIVMPACQFALYAGFSTIYLVGCDCTGYFHTNNFTLKQNNFKIDTHILPYWIKMYEHKNKHYPSTKIISLNPIGLKGVMDNDINTV